MRIEAVRSRGAGRSLYPFEALAIGEEFTAARNMGTMSNYRCKRKHSVAEAARQYGKRSGRTFEVRVRDAETVYCRRTS